MQFKTHAFSVNGCTFLEGAKIQTKAFRVHTIYGVSLGISIHSILKLLFGHETVKY